MGIEGDESERLRWIDAVRGIAILLIVLWHAYLFTKFTGLDVGYWETINQSLRLIRMPLFFLASGILVAGALDRPWRQLRRTKLATWLWMYVLWALITVGVFSIVRWDRPDPPADSPWDLVQIIVWPNTGLWYLYALAVFLGVSKLTRTWPALVVLGLAAALSITTFTWLPIGNFALDSMAKFFVFYAIGARSDQFLKARVSRLGRGRALVVLVAGSLLGGGGLMALQATGITGDDLQQIPAVPLLLCIIACVVGVCLAVVLAEYRLGRPLVALGRRTLPVYVSNEIVLGCLTALMVLAVPHVAERIGWLAVPALVIVALPLTLLLQRVSSFAPWLYEAPIRMTRPVPGRNALAGRGASRGCLLHRRVRS